MVYLICRLCGRPFASHQQLYEAKYVMLAMSSEQLWLALVADHLQVFN